MDRSYCIIIQKTGLANEDTLAKLKEEATALEQSTVLKHKIKFYIIESGVYYYEYKDDAKKVRSGIEQTLCSKFPALGIKLDVRETISLPGTRPF